MRIGGIQKTTLIDYPEKIATTIFTVGCNFSCNYCHNPELVLPKKFSTPLIEEEEIFSFLKSRVGKLEAVCVSGGEPTLQMDLSSFIQKIKKLGFLVKLDTNGLFPEKLKNIFQEGGVDYVAMDIKAPLKKYKYFSSQKNIKSVVQKSISLIKNYGIDYEFRTTVAKPLILTKDFEDIGKLINGASRYFIQNYVKASKQLDKSISLKPFTIKELLIAKNIMKKHVHSVFIR
jgi:pyruvate formate lyase activating enzyme